MSLQVQKDRLDPLADRSEVNAIVGLVFARRPDDGCRQGGGSFGEVAAGVSLVADDDLPAASLRSFEQLDPEPQKKRECEAQ
jgi:hypothetical protein